MEEFTIGELARQTGVAVSAIRYYESVGLLPPAPRIGSWRMYERGAVDRLRMIRAARELGFSVEDLRVLISAIGQPISERWRELARTKLPEIGQQIERARAVKELFDQALKCDCLEIEECFGDGRAFCSPATLIIPAEIDINRASSLA